MRRAQASSDAGLNGGSDAFTPELSYTHQVAGDSNSGDSNSPLASISEEPANLSSSSKFNRARSASVSRSPSSRSSGSGFSCTGSDASSRAGNLGPAEIELHGELNALEEAQAAKYGSAHDVVVRPEALRDMYAERLRVFLKGVRAIRDANEVVHPQRLRALLDVPEPRTGSYLITAVKQRKLDAIRVLTGNHPTLKIEDSRRNVVAMADPNVRGQLGRTALYEACSWGEPEAVSMLLAYQQGWSLPFDSESGIGLLPLNLGLSDNTDTSPLMVAVQRRHVHVVALLTNAATAKPHPNVAVSLRAWPAPFTLSASRSSYNSFGSNGSSFTTSLIPSGLEGSRGTDIVNARDMKGQTALLMACNMDIDNLEIVQHLLQGQADVGISDQSGMSPLHYACQRLHAQLVPLLLQQSASPNAKDIAYERTPLHYATNHDAPSAAMVNTLLAANADIGVRDKDGNTPLHLLFLKKRALLPETATVVDATRMLFRADYNSRDERFSKDYKLSALKETVDLILARATQQKGADFVARLLALTNHKKEVCFGPEDKRRHFEYMRTALNDAVGTAAVEGSKPADGELFQNILTQQSVDAKWIETCRAARMIQGLLFCALIAAFSVVAVVRAGAGGQGAEVHSSLQAIILNGRFSSSSQHTTTSSSLPGGSNSGDDHGSVAEPSLRQGVPFTELASAEDALEYFAGILEDLNLARTAETASMAPQRYFAAAGPTITAGAAPMATSAQFSSRTVGVVVGAPILKQWRAVNYRSNSGNSGNSMPCAVSEKVVLQQPCAHGFAASSRLDELPPHSPHASLLAPAYVWREWSGDLPWKASSDEKYPAGAYSLELPLVNAPAASAPSTEKSCGKDGGEEEGEDECIAEVDAADLLRALASHGWADSATRGLSLEITFYNPTRNRLSAVQLLVEHRDGVGLRTVHRLRMHKMYTWNFRPPRIGSKDKALGALFKILEVLVATIIPCVVLQDIYENSAIKPLAKSLFLVVIHSTAPVAFKDMLFQESERLFKFVIDSTCLILWGLIAYMEWQITATVNTITWGPTRHYASVQTLVAQMSYQDALIALLMLTLSTKLVVSKLRAFRGIIILLKAIRHMMMALANFFAVLIITYFTVGSAKFLVSPNSMGYFDAIIGEFWASVDGGAKSETTKNQSELAILLLKLLDFGRAVVVTMVMMNIITTMLTDSYSSVKDKAEASWCQKQVLMIFEEETKKATIEKQKTGKVVTISASRAKDNASGHNSLPPNISISEGARKRFISAVKRIIRRINPLRIFSKHEYCCRDSIPDLAQHVMSDARDKDNLNQAVNDVIPELAFFVGDMRTPDGHEHNDRITEKIMHTFQGLRRCMASNVSMFDTFIVGGKPGNLEPLNDDEESAVVFAELQNFVMIKVGLERSVIVEAMLACLVYDQLGKVQLWRAQLQQCIPNFYDSIADQRVLLQALKDENRDNLARFLPSFASLQLEAQTMIVKAFQADFIFGQFGQLECVPASLSRLKKIACETDGKQKLLFILFMQLLGIVGSPKFKGQLPLSMWHMFYSESICAIERLAIREVTPTQVYDALIETARNQMGAKDMFDRNANGLLACYNTYSNAMSFKDRREFQTFDDFRASLQKALLRLSKMLRLTEATAFQPLFDAALGLPAPKLAQLVCELNRSGIDDGWAILLMYSPQLLLNAQEDGSTPELNETERLRVGLNALVLLYAMARRKLESVMQDLDGIGEPSDWSDDDGTETPAANGIYEVNCYHLSTWAKSTGMLQRITEDWDRCIFMEHLRLLGDLGEAIVIVKPAVNRKI